MEQISFREKLRRRQEKTKSLLCVGLDPLLEKMPAHLRTPGPAGSHDATDTAIWMMRIIDATAAFTCMYKLQRAHWEAITGGVIAMQVVITYIETKYPDIVVFTDCKRGDIGRTQTQYRIAQFDIDGTEGMNFSPYMGKDCMEFLVDPDNKLRGIVGLCYTSNPAAREVQDVKLADGGSYWEFMAEKILQWSKELGITENSGLVMAAAYEFPKGSGKVYSDHLTRVRAIVDNSLWLLIPGVGTQGGFIRETVKTAFTGWGSIAINASSSVIFAGSGEDFTQKAAEESRRLYVAMAEALEIEKYFWVQESLIIYNDPLTTLKNCDGYYNAMNLKGEMIGPLVAYNGTYEVPEESEEPDAKLLKKNFVGAEYYDFAYAEKIPAIRRYFAHLIADKINGLPWVPPDIFLGAVYGGILLAGAVSDLFPGSETVFTSKKVTALKTDKSKEKSEPILERHKIAANKRVCIIEDVSNNFSSIDQMVELVEDLGCDVVMIACAFNRSEMSEYKGIPIVSACQIPTKQWRQDVEEIATLVNLGLVEWSPKNNFEALLLKMKKNEKIATA
ncbi:MAG: orotidine-5'-phosphate decarboxylase [Patescibacteria group bacterium]